MVDGPALTGRPALALAALLALAAGGCGSIPRPTFTSARQLSAEDFRDPEAVPASRPLPVLAPEPERAERVEIRTLTEAEARAEIGEVEASFGEPELAPEGTPEAGPPAALDPDGLELVDAKVGDLNGRPVQAREWLEPMAARLTAESAGKTREQWRQFAHDAIFTEVVAQLRSELILAEARSSLTPEEKQGLRVFLQRFEQEEVARSYGSQTLAQQRYLQTYGMTLEEAKRERERQALFMDQVQRRISDRVQVSSRDLEIEYERNFEKYNPPPEAVFRVIRVRTADAEAVEAIKGRLQSEPFLEVAPDERNLQKDPLRRSIPEGIEKAELFGTPALQEPAVKLSPGEHTDAIESGSYTWWIYFDSVEDNSRSLYDVQLELRDQITVERRNEELSRYVLRILSRAGVDQGDLDSLTAALVDVAEEWYYRPEGG